MSAIGDGEEKFDIMSGPTGSSGVGDGFDIRIVPVKLRVGAWAFIIFVFIAIRICFIVTSTFYYLRLSFHNAPLIGYILVTLKLA